MNLSPEKLSISLSHSRTASVAVVAEKVAEETIGVDLESKSRGISERAAQKFCTADELALGLTPLQIWVIKEACYKAIPNNAGLVLPYFEVTEWNQKDGIVKLKKGALSGQPQNELRFSLVETDLHWIGFAQNPNADSNASFKKLS